METNTIIVSIFELLVIFKTLDIVASIYFFLNSGGAKGSGMRGMSKLLEISSGFT
jgi:hypothetical protein